MGNDTSLPPAQILGPSPGGATTHSHPGDVDTGWAQLYGPENQLDAQQQELDAALKPKNAFVEPPSQELLQSFAETYWDFCYAWCPVLDRESLDQEMIASPMLANALAAAASNIRPPLLPHEGPARYYNKAKTIFYNDEEPDSLNALKALALFYWWAPRPPSTAAYRHSSWWWTSLIIRIAQQMNIHREPPEDDPIRARIRLSQRRRLWWTAFVSSILSFSRRQPFFYKTDESTQARERLTALCQSKPCIIDPDDCCILEPQPSDFPSDPASQKKGQIFVHWVRLCAIIGRIAKHLSRSASRSEETLPTSLLQELVTWVNSLPPHLQLPIGSARTESFDRDVHQLHLPYLTTIIVLHLRRSTQNLPHVLPPAILAASCVARILRDVLSRGNARFLMAITCWYAGMAFIALLQACRIEEFAKEAQEDLDILDRAVEQLQQIWATANVIRGGFERMRKTNGPGSMNGTTYRFSAESSAENASTDAAGVFPNPTRAEDFDWTLLFPFVTPVTNRIAGVLLHEKAQGTFMQTPAVSPFVDTLWMQYQDLLQPFTDYNFDVASVM